ncbi:MAG TPA: alpha/beta hydrolase [Streptosporangiaceae bacterium]|nr:alpha/beta hydrolase [Streptosporangiaceae bacterium]
MTTSEPLAERFPGLDPDLAGMLEKAAAAGLPGITELTPAQARERVRAGDAAVPAGPAMRAVTEERLRPGEIPVRRYQPPGPCTAAAVVWFHGGGWVTGDLNYSDEICRLIAEEAGCEVVSVGYRLAPEHRFPAAVEDGLTAARCVAAGGSGGPARTVVLAGDSAGGNIAAVCAQELAPDPDLTLAGQLLVYPVLDDDVTRDSYRRNDGLVLGAREMGWFFDQYCPPDERRSSLFAPLRARELAALPATAITIAGHDPLYDEGGAYARALAAAGTEVTVLDYPSLVHGFLRFTGVAPAAAAAAREVARAAARLVRSS